MRSLILLLWIGTVAAISTVGWLRILVLYHAGWSPLIWLLVAVIVVGTAAAFWLTVAAAWHRYRRFVL